MRTVKLQMGVINTAAEIRGNSSLPNITLTSQPRTFFSDIPITFVLRKNEVVIPLYSRVAEHVAPYHYILC